MDAEHKKCVVRTRWTPTPEQLQFLKQLYYNQGMRNPSEDEIEKISLRLRQFGNIEEKNVFYWFQNQKNREKRWAKRQAAGAAIPATRRRGNAMCSRPITLPLFPMHCDSVSGCTRKDDADGPQFSLELSLRPYSSTC